MPLPAAFTLTFRPRQANAGILLRKIVFCSESQVGTRVLEQIQLATHSLSSTRGYLKYSEYYSSYSSTHRAQLEVIHDSKTHAYSYVVVPTLYIHCRYSNIHSYSTFTCTSCSLNQLTSQGTQSSRQLSAVSKYCTRVEYTTDSSLLVVPNGSVPSQLVGTRVGGRRKLFPPFCNRNVSTIGTVSTILVLAN